MYLLKLFKKYIWKKMVRSVSYILKDNLILNNRKQKC